MLFYFLTQMRGFEAVSTKHRQQNGQPRLMLQLFLVLFSNKLDTVPRTSPTAWSISGITIPTPTLQTPAVQETARWDSLWPVSNTLPSMCSNLVQAETPLCPDVPQMQPSSAASAPACLPCSHQHRAWVRDLQSATHKARTHVVHRDPAGNTHRM